MDKQTIKLTNNSVFSLAFEANASSSGGIQTLIERKNEIAVSIHFSVQQVQPNVVITFNNRCHITLTRGQQVDAKILNAASWIICPLQSYRYLDANLFQLVGFNQIQTMEFKL